MFHEFKHNLYITLAKYLEQEGIANLLFSVCLYTVFLSSELISWDDSSRLLDDAKSPGGRLNTHTPYVCGFAWSDMVHGCMVYTERAKMAAVSCHQPCQRCKYTTSVDIQKRAIKSYSLM